jgi:hypothetical protein
MPMPAQKSTESSVVCAECERLRAELEATNAAMDDEIASHQDTLRLWNALRAERAKPTPSDAELARKVVHDFCGDTCQLMNGCGCYDGIMAALASIRAEGSAERDELKAGYETQRDYIEDLLAKCVKLEAALHAARPAVIICLGTGELPGFTSVLPQIDAALAQPAESGATEPCQQWGGEPCVYPRCDCAGAKP